MKRLLLLSLTLLTVIAMYAGKITEQEALQKAKQFMKGKEFVTTKASRSSSKTDAVDKAYYIFNAKNNGGFVIVSGDDRMTEILGYSDHGSFDLSNVPTNVRWLLDQYEKVAASIDTQIVKSVPRRTPIPKEDIAPFITTTWGQHNPYNSQCPTINGQRCATGCVATAMAQVVNYTKWPKKGITTEAIIPSYITKTNRLSMPTLEKIEFDWDSMGDNEIARLMLYCGQSVQMDYGLESSAYDASIPKGLIWYFGYDQATRIIYRKAYNNEDWHTLLYEELKNKRPIIYSGQSQKDGHTFVIHGYKGSDDMYYINWGWDGLCDGYFLLTDLNPQESRVYSNDQTAIIGIQAPTGEDGIVRPQCSVVDMAISGSNELTRLDNGDNFSAIHITTTIESNLVEDTDVEVGYALYKDSCLLSILSQLSVKAIVGEKNVYDASVSFGKNLNDGMYRIVSVSRASNGDNWMPNEGSGIIYIEASISENVLNLNVKSNKPVDEQLKFDIIVTGKVEVMALNRDIAGEIEVPPAVIINGVEHKVTRVAEFGFNETKISSIKLPETIEEIKNYSFWNCKELKTVSMPKSLKTMGFSVFNGCSKLSSISLPTSLYSIGVRTFEDCSSLTSISIPSKVTTIPNRCFWGCSNLIHVDLPSTITSIDYEAFAYCSSLKTIDIPSNVTSVKGGAFEGCSSLVSISLPSKVSEIVKLTFKGCSSLEEFKIPLKVIAIGEGAFRDCSKLSSIIIPPKTKIIEQSAFAGCTSLSSITVKLANPIEILNNVFSENTYNSARLYIPTGRSEYYKEADGWKNFKLITEKEMPDVIISDSPFANIKSNQMILGYYRTDDYENSPSSGLGGINAGNYKACISFPKRFVKPFAGNMITYIRFALVDTDIADAKLFISNARDGEVLYSQTVSSLKLGWNEIKLNEAFEIKNEELWIGLEYKQNDEKYPFSYVNGGEEGSCYFHGPYEEWYNDNGVEYISSWIEGEDLSLSLQCLLEGESIPLYCLYADVYALSESYKYKSYYRKGINEILADCGVKNIGKKAIEECEIKLLLDGKETNAVSYRKFAPIDVLSVNSVTYRLPIPSNMAVGKHTVSCYVKSINGEMPTHTIEPIPFSMKLYSKDLGRHKAYVEHETAIWCPHSTAWWKRLNSYEIPKREDITLVCLHRDELGCLAAEEYINAYYKNHGVPALTVDRSTDKYGTADGLNFWGTGVLDNIDDFLQIPSFATVNISAEYIPVSRNLKIKITGERNEEFEIFDGYANLTVLITEDDVIIPQYDGEKKMWIYDYHHKAFLRTNVSDVWGDAVVWDGDKYEMDYSIHLDENWAKDNMKIVAYLAKPFTGNNYDDVYIINCNDFMVKNATINESPINTINEKLREDAASFDVYDMSGRKVRRQVTTLQNLPKGVYMVNGRKRVVK